jgi:hypothetical protein
MSGLAEKLARRMIADQGLAVIWKLHSDAATLYRIGNVIAANSFIEIADLAESEWLQQTGGTAEANAP